MKPKFKVGDLLYHRSGDIIRVAEVAKSNSKLKKCPWEYVYTYVKVRYKTNPNEIHFCPTDVMERNWKPLKDEDKIKLL